MLLAYIDESGINYGKSNRYWTDGPYAIWSSILINEKKYFDIERSFQDLAREFLKETRLRRELHANEIWESRKRSSIRKERVSKYFEELIQLTSKLRIPIIFGIQQKNPKFRSSNVHGKSIELSNARYSLLTLMEHKLAQLNETAVLVSDEESTRQELKNLVFQRTKWRYSPPGRRTIGQKPKYEFEYRSNFILDQLHYVDSKDSLLIQFSDHICFVLKRVFEHMYLVEFPGPNKPSPDKSMVPICQETFNAFVSFCNIMCANYNVREKDVMMTELSNLQDVQYLFETRTTGLSTFPRIVTPTHQILNSFTPYG